MSGMKKILFVLIFLGFCDLAIANNKDVVRIGDNATVEWNETVSNFVVIGGDATVNGTVSEDAVVIGGDLNVGPTGKIHGASVAIFGKIIKDPGAEVSNDTFEFSRYLIPSFIIPIVGICTLGFFWVIMLVGFTAIFLLIAILFTPRVGRVSFYVEKHFWKSLYYGLIALVLFLPVIIFLIVSVIGIPLIPIVMIALSAATLFGYTAICQLIGLKCFKAIKKSGQPMILEVLVGAVILGFITFVPVVGWAIKLLAWLAGLGATAATKFGAFQRQ